MTCRERTVAAPRRALTLLELIVALAVLVGTASLLMQLVDLGSHHAERAQQITDAQVAAHNLLSEFLVGIRPWETSETYLPIDTWSPWEYQLRLEPVGFGDLVSATLTVAPRADGPVMPMEGSMTAGAPATTPPPAASSPTEQTLSTLDTDAIRPGSYRLTRWIHQPSSPAGQDQDAGGTNKLDADGVAPADARAF